VENQQYMSSSESREEASAGARQSMSDLLDEQLSRVVPERGETLEGVIVSKRSDEIIVDIGCKSEGIVTSRDLERLDREFVRNLKVGDKVWVYVLRPEDASGNSILSLSRALVENDWQRAQALYKSGEIFECAVQDCNRGGLIVPIGQVRGFVPASQVTTVRVPRGVDDETRQEILRQCVGKTLKFKIIEVDRRRNRLILSERAAVREARQQAKERLLDELEEGQVRSGVVSSLCDFGAFVDLGGADGLIHLSELSWSRVSHPSEVLEVGQKIDVYVLGVDRERRRIALSLKRLKAEPWSTVEERYRVGQIVKATITKVTDFGAFARLDQDIEGLIHISELSDERIEHPSEVVQEGEELELRIIRIDPARQRMGLSLRRVNEEFFDDYDWESEFDDMSGFGSQEAEAMGSEAESGEVEADV